jgi:hypothetical protein
MILQQVMMQLSKSGVGASKKVPKLVMLSEYGLAIHKDINNNTTWVISHFNSGRSVLKYIKERKDVEEYIVRLIEILPSWQFTLEEFDSGVVDKPRVKKEVDALQKEIMEEK